MAGALALATEPLLIECILFSRHKEKTNVISFNLKAFTTLLTAGVGFCMSSLKYWAWPFCFYSNFYSVSEISAWKVIIDVRDFLLKVRVKSAISW